MIFPEKLDVLTVHATLIAETGGTSGVRDEALLESALEAAKNASSQLNREQVERRLRENVRVKGDLID
jgi:prophage maintenance system killer protein